MQDKAEICSHIHRMTRASNPAIRPQTRELEAETRGATGIYNAQGNYSHPVAAATDMGCFFRKTP